MTTDSKPSLEVLKVIISTLLTLTLIGTLSCKPVNPDSEVKHVWGETGRDVSNYEFKPCKEEKSPKFPKARAYIKELAQIITRNNRNLFKGKLSLSNFCFFIEDDPTVNAYANTRKRRITFNTSLLLEADSDAFVAYIMSHELAHVSMLHGKVRHPDYIPSEKFKKLTLQLKQLIANFGEVDFEKMFPNVVAYGQDNIEFTAKISPILQALESQYGPSGSSLPPRNDIENGSAPIPLEVQFANEFPKELQVEAKNFAVEYKFFQINVKKYKNSEKRIQTEMKFEMSKDPSIGVSDAYNWAEKEADEVGFELFVKSGFDSTKMTDALLAIEFQTIMRGSSGGMSTIECLSLGMRAQTTKKLKELLHGDKVERGKGSHPNSCWRLLHHFYEGRIHKDDYSGKSFSGDLLNVTPLRMQAIDEIFQKSQFVNFGNSSTAQPNHRSQGGGAFPQGGGTFPQGGGTFPQEEATENSDVGVNRYESQSQDADAGISSR